MTRWLWLSLLVIGLDQTSKQWVEAGLSLYESIAVMPMLNLTLVYNQGAAFSFLSDQGGWQRWFFVVLAIGVVLVLINWIRRLKAEEWIIAVALSLVIGGALGNVIDRLLWGHVIDFIDVYYDNWHWPAFNVADSAIVAGVALILFEAFFLKTDKKS